jgi:glycosyltransferase involved in cell wall biosynthesis
MGVPVVARSAGAVAEVAGDAALLAGPHDDEAVLAELTALVLEDDALHAELVRRGHARAAAFAPERVETRLRGVVESALA